MTSEQQSGIMFRFTHITPYDISGFGEMICSAENPQTLLVCLRGEGTVWIEGTSFKMRRGQALFVPPQFSLQLISEQQPFKGYLIRFDAYAETETHTYTRISEYSNEHSFIGDWPQMLKCCDYLLQSQVTPARDQLHEQALLYRIIGLATQGQMEKKKAETADEAIARVSAFLEENFAYQHSRAELAKLSGLSPGYFSSLFQQLTGKSPTAYVTDIRIRRAQEFLFSGKVVKETAERVGFADEFYFSRRFKQHTGLSPVAFVKSRRRNIASLSDPLSANLLALRLLPTVAAFYDHHPSNNRMVRLHSCELGRGDGWETNLTMLRKAAPEMIFCTDFLGAPVMKDLERIAPTIPIDWLGMNWRRQFRIMADALGQRDEANSWLSDYEHRGEETYRKVRRKYGGATLNIWRVMDSQYRIYGERNAGTVLYDDLKFTSTYNLSDVHVYEVVSLESLLTYDADMLLVMVDVTPRAVRQWDKIRASAGWERLKAARSGHVYEIGTDKLFEYSALSHERALIHLAQIFR